MRVALSFVVGSQFAGMMLLAGCGGGASEAPAAQRGAGRPGGPGNRPPAPVEVVVAALGAVTRTATVSGVVEPLRSVGVNAQLPGALLSVRVEEGTRVRTGQVLAEIDAREIAAQLRSAEANLAVARSTAERAEQLWQQKIITVQEYERDRAALAAAEAQADQLRTRLGYATVRSPISGIITEKRVEAGDIVGNLTRLFTVAEIGTLVVRVPVSELEVAHLDAGDPVDVVIDALPGLEVNARVRRVFPSVDSVTRQVPVEVALTGPGAREVMPGFLARITFDVGDGDSAVLLPSAAVVGAASPEPAVFLVQRDTARRTPVRLGTTAMGRVQIVQGVRPGDSVVSVGNVGLRDAGPVRVVPPVQPAESAGAGAQKEGT